MDAIMKTSAAARGGFNRWEKGGKHRVYGNNGYRGFYEVKIFGGVPHLGGKMRNGLGLFEMVEAAGFTPDSTSLRGPGFTWVKITP